MDSKKYRDLYLKKIDKTSNKLNKQIKFYNNFFPQIGGAEKTEAEKTEEVIPSKLTALENSVEILKKNIEEFIKKNMDNNSDTKGLAKSLKDATAKIDETTKKNEKLTKTINSLNQVIEEKTNKLNTQVERLNTDLAQQIKSNKPPSDSPQKAEGNPSIQEPKIKRPFVVRSASEKGQATPQQGQLQRSTSTR